jgi:photosystem II stability/assembly factor-like uncharacterized protein
MRGGIARQIPYISLLTFAQLCFLSVVTHGDTVENGQWSNNFPQVTRITAIAADPANDARILAGSGIGKPLFRTTDGGRSWDAIGNGLNAAVWALAFDAGDPNRLYAGTYSGGAFRSTDAGETWASINQGLGDSGKLPGVASMVADPKRADVIYAGLRGEMTTIFARPGASVSADSLPSTIYHGGIYKSTDGGSSWHPSQNGIPVPETSPLSVSALAIDPKNSEHLYAGARALFESTDGAATWTPLPNTPPGAGEINAILIDPTNTEVLYVATTFNGIFKSTDGGGTWIPASRGLQKPTIITLILDPENPEMLYTVAGRPWYAATGPIDIYRSDNGAASWNPFEPSLPSVYGAFALALTGPANSRTLHVGTEGGVLSTSVPRSSAFYLPHLGDGTSGSLRLRTNLMLTNLGPEAAVKVDFFSPGGNPLMLQFGSREPTSSLTLTMKTGEIFSEWSAGLGPLTLGYARVSAPVDITGNVIFACEQDQAILYETGVPAVRLPARDLTLFFDCDSPQSNVGMAVVNRGTATAAVKLTLYDQDFGVVAKRTLAEAVGHDLHSGESIARYVTEIFPEIRGLSIRTGTVTLESDQDVAAITLHELRTGSTIQMSTFPMIPGRADQNSRPIYHGPLIFPQIANGQLADVTFRTEIILVNTGGDASASVYFQGGQGEAVEFDFEGFGSKSNIAVNLPAGHAVKLRTKGSGELHTGYATIHSSYGGDVRGFITLVQSDSQSSTEATVMACPEQVTFSFSFDTSEPSVNTGLAFCGKGDSPVLTHVECKLYDESAQLVATREFPFMPYGHTAQFATELFPEIRTSKMSRGLITVESSALLVPLVLREHLVNAPSFPEPLYRLTTLPVFRKGMD